MKLSEIIKAAIPFYVKEDIRRHQENYRCRYMCWAVADAHYYNLISEADLLAFDEFIDEKIEKHSTLHSFLMQKDKEYKSLFLSLPQTHQFADRRHGHKQMQNARLNWYLELIKKLEKAGN